MKPCPTDTTGTPRLLLRPQEAAQSLGVSLRTVMAWVGAGEIPFVRIGERNLRFPLEALREWVAARTSWPTQLVPSGPEQSSVSAGNPGASKNGAAVGAAKQTPL